MFINTGSQFEITLIMLVLGFALGVLFNISDAITTIFNNKLWIKIVCEFFATIICCICVYCAAQVLYFGLIRPYMLCAAILGLYLEIITIGKFVKGAIIFAKNWIKRAILSFKATKIGSKIAK